MLIVKQTFNFEHNCPTNITKCIKCIKFIIRFFKYNTCQYEQLRLIVIDEIFLVHVKMYDVIDNQG